MNEEHTSNILISIFFSAFFGVRVIQTFDLFYKVELRKDDYKSVRNKRYRGIRQNLFEIFFKLLVKPQYFN